jgi:N-acetylglucosamine repressor
MKKVFMGTLVRGNRELIKAMNRSLVFNAIRRHALLSRTQLIEITGLSIGAVSQITGELIQDGWILEVGEGDYTGGRRQMLLRLNPTAGYAVGLKLMENRVVCAVTNLEGTVLHYQEHHIPFGKDAQAVCRTLSLLTEQIITTSDIPRSKVFGVGIGLAGVIYPQTGVVHYSPFFDWHDTPFSQMLHERLKLPVFIENDVNTLTITELLFDVGRGRPNFVVVTVGRGIGMGIVINHQLYQGQKGGVGEIGHIPIELSGPLCDCGKSGCLEALAADPAVMRYIREMNGEPYLDSISAVVTAAEAGNTLAREALAISGKYLGVGLATVVNLLNPSLLILSGEGLSAGDFRLKPMFEAFRENTFNGLLDDVEIMVKQMDDQAWARGAASVVIGKIFESPLV